MNTVRPQARRLRVEYERPRWYKLLYAITEGLVLLGVAYLLLVLWLGQ